MIRRSGIITGPGAVRDALSFHLYPPHVFVQTAQAPEQIPVPDDNCRRPDGSEQERVPHQLKAAPGTQPQSGRREQLHVTAAHHFQQGKRPEQQPGQQESCESIRKHNGRRSSLQQEKAARKQRSGKAAQNQGVGNAMRSHIADSTDEDEGKQCFKSHGENPFMMDRTGGTDVTD